MLQDLLSLRDYEPPMGDTAGYQPLSFCRALWTAPIEGEETAPAHRIIHARVLQLHEAIPLKRLGVRRARGYHKCGSILDHDWVTAFRVLAWQDEAWRVLRYERDVPCPTADAVQWFDLDAVETSALMIEVRRCGIDEWWPSWNLASGAFLLESEAPVRLAPRQERLLDTTDVSLVGLPRGLEVEQSPGEVRFRSRYLDVGFCLNRAGFSHFGLDEEGQHRTEDNLLRYGPGLFFQGPQLHPVGHAPVAAWALRNAAHGTTQVQGNRVTYDLTLGETGQHYRLAWDVLEDRLVLHAERRADRPLRAWISTAWSLGINCAVAPMHTLGRIARTGQTGLIPPPAWLHLPRFGSLRLDANATESTWLRSDAYRPLDMTTLEVKLGEVPQPEGDYLLLAGRFRTRLEWTLGTLSVPLREDTPSEIARAARRCALTALTYRADTATLSNNGASIHCPISMDGWAATTTHLGTLLPGLDAVDLLRDSLERWLDGGPGYASGRLLQDGEMHPAEDEYLMTGTACLLGLADFLNHSGTAAWVAQYHEPIRRELHRMRARDLDGDGLIESPYRTGVSGTGQWSTCWFDVVSYGWKDAFSNALLYPALTKLADALPRLGAADLAEDLADWAARLRASYRPTFLNPETGWLAGWRCKEDRLHDYAFLPPNGAAICSGLLEEDEATSVMERLWQETQRVGLPDPYLGLPGNLWPIPDADLSDIMQGYPLGFYQNGGRTHSQARHFVGALYRVGMTQEADYLLSRLCKGLADGAVYGGCRSGLDWRYWDGRPCGYEGLLTDQFSLLGLALERYGRPDGQ